MKTVMGKISALLLLVLAATVPATTLAEDQGLSLQDDAPIYTGPLEEGDLEELTLKDFGAFGVDPQGPEHQYRLYQAALEQPVLGALLPYKLRIVDRDLAMEDFLGVDVPEELAQARYDSYADMIPVTVNGRTTHYVYVYHRPLPRAPAPAI